MDVVLILLGMGAFIGLIIYITHQQEKKRQAALATFANEQNYQFVAGDDSSILGKYDQFSLFRRGRSKRGKNSLTQTKDGFFLHIFDYQYTTGSGKSKSTHQRTCIYIKGEQAVFPHFFLRREIAVFDFLGKIFGGQDINFDSDSEFSNSFVLQGNDAEKTRYFFSSKRTREACLIYKGTEATIEGNQDALMISLYQLSPEKLPLEIENALLLYNSIVPNS